MREASNIIVSAIVVSKGTGNYIFSCLESLYRQAKVPDEVIVIDNSLNKDFPPALQRTYSDIKVYVASENLFYCAALNKGIDISRGDFILCLNDDVILDGGFIKLSIEGFLKDRAIGMVSGKILRLQGDILDSTGLFFTPWGAAKERGYGQKDEGRYEKEEYIFGVNGAAAFYRRHMLEDIKIGAEYLDSDYRIFYEDLDVSWRAQNAGWKAYYIPQAIAYHARGATARASPVTGANKRWARRYLNNQLYLDLFKNRYLTIIRNETIAGFLLRAPFMFFYDLAAWAYTLFFRPKIIIDFFLNINYLKDAFKKRILIRNVNKKRRISGRAVL